MTKNRKIEKWREERKIQIYNKKSKTMLQKC